MKDYTNFFQICSAVKFLCKFLHISINPWFATYIHQNRFIKSEQLVRDNSNDALPDKTAAGAMHVKCMQTHSSLLTYNRKNDSTIQSHDLFFVFKGSDCSGRRKKKRSIEAKLRIYISRVSLEWKTWLALRANPDFGERCWWRFPEKHALYITACRLEHRGLFTFMKSN